MVGGGHEIDASFIETVTSGPSKGPMKGIFLFSELFMIVRSMFRFGMCFWFYFHTCSVSLILGLTVDW